MTTLVKGLNRNERILLFLYEFGKDRKTRIQYEDIVAGIFKKYPSEFQLKGYPQYPDSGSIQKRLYDFKREGFVNAQNNVFSLTDRGIDFAERLSKKGKGLPGQTEERLSRSEEIEFYRVKNSEGFILFLTGKQESLSDSDFYNYLGVTARTPKNAFIGRLNTMLATVKALKKNSNDPLRAKFVNYHEHMTDKHKGIIDFFYQS